MRVFVTGANGFVGGGVTASLLAAGHEVVGLVRGAGTVPDGVRAVSGSITDAKPDKLAEAMEGCDAIVHLVGIISEDRAKHQTFPQVHVIGTGNVLAAAAIVGAGKSRFVYVSAIGASPASKSEYSRTKARAESLVQTSPLPWTIFRPSIVIGKNAAFLKQMEQLIRKPPGSPFPVPFVPVPGNGQNRFQPVYLGDLSRCVAECLSRPATTNCLFEIGGADEVTFDELILGVERRIGVLKPLLHTPMGAMFAAAAVLESVLPHPPVTTDQLQNLGLDNVCDNSAVKLAFEFAPMGFLDALTRCYGR